MSLRTTAISLAACSLSLLGCNSLPRPKPIDTQALSPNFRVQCVSLAGENLNIQNIPRSEVCSEEFAAAGRINIQTAATQTQAAQVFAAQFALRGSATQGSLAVHSPLGTTLAELHWQPGLAQLLQGGEPQQYTSVPAMMQALTGSSLPMPLLFDWLQGKASSSADWQVDLSRYSSGIIAASQTQTTPPTQVRIRLDATE